MPQPLGLLAQSVACRSGGLVILTTCTSIDCYKIEPMSMTQLMKSPCWLDCFSVNY